MSTRKVLTSIVLVLAMLVLFGTTSVKAATGDFNLGIVYNNSRIELPVNENTKISELKELIKANDKLGIDVNKQRLTITVNDPITFMPKEVVLEDAKTLLESGISGTVGPNVTNTISVREIVDTEKRLTVKSVHPQNEEDAEFLLEDMYTKLYEDGMESIRPAQGDDTFTKFTATDATKFYPNIIVEYVYNNEISKKLNKIIGDIDNKNEFEVKDLELINYWLNGGTFLAYSSDFTKTINYKNLGAFDIEGTQGLGSDEPLRTIQGLAVKFIYDDVTYHVKSLTMISGTHIIYVPTDTNKASFLSIAQQRIDDYVGAGKAVISKLGTKDDVINAYIEDNKEELNMRYESENQYNPNPKTKEEFMASYKAEIGELVQEVLDNVANKSDGYIYKVTTGDTHHYVVIAADSSKMFTPTYQSSDILTDVTVSSNSGKLPLDTLIQVKEITGGEEYDRIEKILKVSNNSMFDLKLFSNGLNKNITKLDDGSFDVKIPVTEKFKGKKLIVYYVDDNGKIEKHEVLTKDGYAIFNTNHFSVYTLAEKPAETFSIKVVTDEGATISPNGTVTGTIGETKTFTVTLKNGYEILKAEFGNQYMGSDVDVENNKITVKPNAEGEWELKVTTKKVTEKPDETPSETPSSEDNTNNEKDETPKTGNPANVAIVLAIFAMFGVGVALIIKNKNN